MFPSEISSFRRIEVYRAKHRQRFSRLLFPIRTKLLQFPVIKRRKYKIEKEKEWRRGKKGRFDSRVSMRFEARPEFEMRVSIPERGAPAPIGALYRRPWRCSQFLKCFTSVQRTPRNRKLGTACRLKLRAQKTTGDRTLLHSRGRFLLVSETFE